MLFLEPENKIIKDVLEGRLGEKAPRPVEPLEIRLCDFDDVQYDISIANSKLSISMAYAPFKAHRQLLPGAQERHGQHARARADPVPPQRVHVRRAAVGPHRDRLLVCFEDKTDQAIARVFLQEFVDTRRSVNNAPPVAFSKDPPLELRGAPGLRASDDLVGYLSLAIFPSHVETDEKRAKAASLVQGFRNYLHYHIKASKTHLHIRMRKRVDLLLQVLNRARPEKDPSKATKKTISGRTFARQ
ncbi:hypothetical protein PINS_up022897 [Pythium insidiosum]|nr:hypothetical protein PINS_up022897 [Pythium insidiosum]